MSSAQSLSVPLPDAGVPALQIEGLTKVYPKGVRAVDSVTLSVGEGEIFGLLGPNGAGKSTIIKSTMTLTEPTSGTIKVNGIDALAHPAEARRTTGYVPQEVSVDGDLTGYENLLVFSKLYQVDRKERSGRIREALRRMGLEGRADDLVKTYSGGMMRRLEIAQSLVNQPSLLFLDEPSIGLDPSARHEVWAHIKELRETLNATIFITTHDMVEAERLCDRIAILNQGRVVVWGTPEELRSLVGGEVVVVKTSGGGDIKGALPSDLGTVLSNSTVGGETSIVVRGRAEEAVPKIMRVLEEGGMSIESLSISKPTLDDVFLKFTKTRISEAESSKQARLTRRSFRKHAR
jgi:ABC-2 type transport system ATP-binding protein